MIPAVTVGRGRPRGGEPGRGRGRLRRQGGQEGRRPGRGRGGAVAGPWWGEAAAREVERQVGGPSSLRQQPAEDEGILGGINRMIDRVAQEAARTQDLHCRRVAGRTAKSMSHEAPEDVTFVCSYLTETL